MEKERTTERFIHIVLYITGVYTRVIIMLQQVVNNYLIICASLLDEVQKEELIRAGYLPVDRCMVECRCL